MSLRKTLQTDATAEVEGVWFEFSFNEDLDKPTRFKLARMAISNKRYTKALEAATKPHLHAIQTETLAEETAKRLFMGIFLDTILLDYDGVSLSDVTGNPDEDKVEAPFSRENAQRLLERYPADLYGPLETQAKRLSMFRAKELDTNAKN